jgi:hypothetical protein
MAQNQKLAGKQPNDQPELHKRPFIKRLGSNVRAWAFPALAALTFSPIFPFQATKAKAEGTEQGAPQQTMMVQGKVLNVVQLDKSLVQLENDAAGMASLDEKSEPAYGYTATAYIKPMKLCFIVSFDSTETISKILAVNFPSIKDTHSEPNADNLGIEPIPGHRDIDLTNFANMVQTQTGSKLERVKMILEMKAQCINVFILPIDSQGKITTALGEGKYLIYEGSYADGRVSGGLAVLIEPNKTYTLSLSMTSR